MREFRLGHEQLVHVQPPCARGSRFRDEISVPEVFASLPCAQLHPDDVQQPQVEVCILQLPDELGAEEHVVCFRLLVRVWLRVGELGVGVKLSLGLRPGLCLDLVEVLLVAVQVFARPLWLREQLRGHRGWLRAVPFLDRALGRAVVGMVEDCMLPFEVKVAAALLGDVVLRCHDVVVALNLSVSVFAGAGYTRGNSHSLSLSEKLSRQSVSAHARWSSEQNVLYLSEQTALAQIWEHDSGLVQGQHAPALSQLV